jgi:YidC/Oxa1 family membrane protein insertase
MDKQTIRLIFLFSIFFVGMFLYNAWQEQHLPTTPVVQQEGGLTANTTSSSNSKEITAQDIPTLVSDVKSSSTNTEVTSSPLVKDAKRMITVITDVMQVKIDSLGGDLVSLNLPKYPETLNDPQQGFILLDESDTRFYIVQSGLLSDVGPDSNVNGRAQYTFANTEEKMDDAESVLNVDLNYNTTTGVKITKRFIFTRGSYVVRIHYIIDNKGAQNYEASSFGRIKRRAPDNSNSGFFGAMRTYTGAAINTPQKKYQKLPFDDMQKKPFKEDVMGGWAAMVEHYFATALIPSVEDRNYYQTETFPDNTYGIRFVSSAEIIPPNTQKTLELKVYAGPEVAEKLKEVAPGLELTIDYGIFWILCEPIFWLLKTMFDVFGNWGVAIIATTFIIKLLFYKPSASSYKSMGNMRKLQPKIEALKKRYPDDKQKFSQEMMALYKQEKVNPLGGCLPILIQIPVFIALYYVLLESVELRQAPFIWWIKDLSAKDPYYVLPIIMGISMFVQQKLNPAPPDPVQAKVMMFMPVFFTFLFLQFPSGLVLYWVVNNVLSIAQQWYITYKIGKRSK